MRNQAKKIVSLLLAVVGIITAVYPAVGFNASAYSNNNGYFIQQLEGVKSGDIDIFTDAACEKNEISMPVGKSLNINTKYYVLNKTTKSTISGYQCYIYAQAVYNKLFGETPYHATGLKKSEVVVSGSNISSLSYDLLANSGVKAGAYLRTTSSSSGAYNSDNGHSQIIIAYTPDDITVLEANYDWKGSIGLNTFSWSDYNGVYFKNKYLSHIVQPTADNYKEFDSGVNGIEAKIQQLLAVYNDGTYFTRSGKACSDPGGDDCSLKLIPSRGGLPSGKTVADAIGDGSSCNGFARYVFYYIFGSNPFKAPTTSTPSLGDCIQFGGNREHTAIYISEDSNNYYVYDSNWDNVCGVHYNHAIKKSWATKVTFYHANNYNSVIGENPITYSEVAAGTYYIRNVSTGKYLAVSEGKDVNSQNVEIAAFSNNSNAQLMNIAGVTDEAKGYKIRPMLTTTRLVNPHADTVVSGINVDIYNEVAADKSLALRKSQWWKFESASGQFVIRNAQNTACVLDVSGTNVLVNTYNGASTQLWVIQNYISYNANNGSGAPTGQYKNYGSALTLSTVKPTREGYTFLGWAESVTATAAQYQSGGSFTKNANVTLYAVWSKNPAVYTITYNANGGAGAPAAQTKTENVTLTLSTVKPTREGYTFLGWAESATATAAQYQSGGSFTKNANVTIYAVWSKDQVEQTYEEKIVSFMGSADPLAYAEIMLDTPSGYVAGSNLNVRVRIKNLVQDNRMFTVEFELGYDTDKLELLNGRLSDEALDLSAKLPGSGWENLSSAKDGKVFIRFANTEGGTDGIFWIDDFEVTLRFKVKTDATGKVGIWVPHDNVTVSDKQLNVHKGKGSYVILDKMAYVPGDVSGNNVIDAVDYAMAKRSCLNTFTLSPEQLIRGDINGNGKVEAVEYAMIKRHVIGTYVIPGAEGR